MKALLEFLNDIKSGKERVEAPVYSHLTYDREEGAVEVVEGADIVIIEGINVLQSPTLEDDREDPRIFVSDFFDFSIYVDAEESRIFTWYLERFRLLRETAFQIRLLIFINLRICLMQKRIPWPPPFGRASTVRICMKISCRQNSDRI